MNKKLLSLLLIILVLASGIPGYAAKKADRSQSETTEGLKTYKFFRSSRPRIIKPYQTVVYSTDANNLTTMRGDILYHTKDTLVGLSVNPSGANVGIITKNKKGEKIAQVYHTGEAERRLFKYDVKRFGMPTAVAYTPDARGIIVASGNSIYFFNPKTFQPVVAIKNVPVEVEKIALSPNGYYMAISGKDRVIVYNLQENKIRRDYKLEEPVNEIMFSPDNKDFAILTADGLLTLYNTRTFEMRKIVDDLGDALAAVYNFDGKYVAVATSPETITLINLLLDSDRETYNTSGGVSDVEFISDSERNTILAYNNLSGIEAIRLLHLKPYYNRLINDEADSRMEEWLKMMPGETIEEYQARVNDATRQRQRRLFEEEAATRLAGNLLDGVSMSLGSYDRANGVLALNFNTMPTIYLPVPESDVTAIHSAGDLRLSDVMYGVMPDDSFEIVYAKVTNTTNGKSYVYDNIMRANMEYMAADDAISLELLQQQQMEELKLQELREKVMREAKLENIISDHTKIAVDSKVVPEYDASGNRILNYVVGVTYTVDPEFSGNEDFGPGKYHIEESGAASSMLNIVKQAFEGDLKQYIVPGKRMKVRILGTADATPIVHGIPYDGTYGNIDDEPVYVDELLKAITVTQAGGIKENEQLALLRAMGVRGYLENNVKGYKDMTKDYTYDVKVSKDKGSEHRRITLELTFIDAF